MIDRFMHLISVARAKMVRDDQPLQMLQVSQGNTGSDTGEAVIDSVPMVGLFGLVSNVPVDAEVILVRLGGDRSQSVAIGTNHRPSRPTGLQPGEVKLYNQAGLSIYLSAGGIEIAAGGLPVTISNAGNMRLETAQLNVTGDIAAECDGTPISLKAVHDAYNAHHHSGVSTGTGVSGLTDHALP